MKNKILDYEQVNEILDNYTKENIFSETDDLGKTEYGLKIRHFIVGNGNNDIVITGATHGSEIITTDFILRLMSDIQNNSLKWNTILKNFRLHLIPMLNPEGYLISTCAVRKLIPRNMSQEEAELICKKYYSVYKADDIENTTDKKHMLMFNNIDYNCIPDEYSSIKNSLKNIFEKYPDLPKNCLHIWSSNANGVDIQANSIYNPKISQILNGEDIFMSSPRHNNINISHPGPINCPFDKENGFKVEKETLAISSLLGSLQEKGKLFAYLNYHSTGGLIFQRPAIAPEEIHLSQDNMLKKQIVNYLFAKAYQDKTYKNTGLNENGTDKKETSKYIIYTKDSNATSSNDIFRLTFPKDLLIELSGMGGNPIGPYGDINGNYTNAINSNLDAINYTLNVASVAQMIAEHSYNVIKKLDPKVDYETLTSVQDIIYKEFAEKVQTFEKLEKEKEEDYDR